jgi:hypothetical protein
MKREQLLFPGSSPPPQQQLPSMFLNNSLTTNGNVLLSSTSINGELSATGRKISTNSPQTPSANQVRFNNLYYF